ncbi:hypothetical protein BDP27DRAFT_1523897, partial [Rhodocollybia butyracea]
MPRESRERRRSNKYFDGGNDVFLIIGGRKIENLKDNLEAADLTLSDEELEGVMPFDLGFSANFIVSL